MLTYLDEGQGEKTLVFIHSYLWDKMMWNPQINYFKNKYRCISIDLIGHGDSHNSDKVLSFENIAKDITNLLENLKVENFSYIGLSVGGMLAPYIFKYNQEKIKQLILMDTYLDEEPTSTKNLYFNMLDTIEKLNCIPDVLIEQIAPIFFSPNVSKDNKTLLENFKYHLKTITQNKIKTIVDFGRLIFGRSSTMSFLSTLKKTPIYFIVGEYDIPRPYKESEEMHKLSLNSKIFKTSNAGHISNLENPKETNKILEEILSSI